MFNFLTFFFCGIPFYLFGLGMIIVTIEELRTWKKGRRNKTNNNTMTDN